MADLERAAEAAVAMLREIAELADATEAALEDVVDRLTARREQLERDAEELATERRERYERLLEDEAERLDLSVEETEAALTEAQADIGAAHQEARRELMEARAVLTVLTDPLAATTDEIADAIDEFNAGVRGLIEEAGAIRSQVEQAFGLTEAFLGQVVEELGTLREAVTARVTALREAMAADYDRAIRDQQLHWLAALKAVEAHVQSAFTKAEQHLEIVTNFGGTEAQRRLAAALDGVTPRVVEASDLVAPLIGQFESVTSESTEDVEDVVGLTDDAGQAADALERDLERLRDALARHTFIKE